MAALARLELTAAEREQFTAQLGDILDYAAQILQVDTTRAPASPDGHDAPPLRADEPQPSLPREDVLRNAPAADPATGLFTVPRVIGS